MGNNNFKIVRKFWKKSFYKERKKVSRLFHEIIIFLQFLNNFFGLLLCKINVTSIYHLVDFLQIFISSESIEDLNWKNS